MDLRGVNCTVSLLLLTCVGLVFGYEVILPGSVNGTLTKNVMFNPKTIPPPPYTLIYWNFGRTNIVTVVGDKIIYDPAYSNRAVFNNNSLSLELKHLTMKDEGEYTLTVNKDGVVPTDTTSLHVFEPVSNVTILPNETELVEFNSTVSLKCSASGSEPISILWLNGSSEVTTVGENKTLTITSLTRDDSGPYTCEASNPVSKEKSHPLNLTIYYGPENIVVNATSVKPIYISGSNITITCSAESHPAAEFQWMVNGTTLVTMGPELKLVNIQTNQSGSYTCNSHNNKTLRYTTFKPINITVLEMISGVTLTGPTGDPIEGDSTNLTCNVSGTIVNTEWTKNNEKLSASDNIAFSADHRTVMINPVKRTDTGLYQCNISNPVSFDTAEFRMTVNYGPDIIRIDGKGDVEEGTRVELYCITESEPPPSYRWEFNGSLTVETSNVFTVERANFSNSGIYNCTALNSITNLTVSKTHILKVKGTGGESGGSLSGGAIAGIVIAVLLVVAAVVGLIVYFVKTKKLSKSTLRQDKQNRATQNGDEHELHYADIQHSANQRQSGLPARAAAKPSQYNQGATTSPDTIYAGVKK
ncbi:carcinoembryonic antigen-related cell adhesion molecule 5-like [Trichomycterus rosablanca]|uniref:carcinoembryonic antigen-related cell adhesion molecule 5-like n=1 Tax=Trichomycterus rosablanca TaxID=2290929 RepID=UPI002F35DF0D